MDNNGNMIIEVGIVLIILLLICGIILASSENTTDKIVKAQEKENIETLLTEMVDNLINNPGVPENWFEYEKGTPGLAIVNEGGETIPNSVSYSKLITLGNNYKKLVTEKLFNSKIKSSMELIPKKSSISSVKIGLSEDANNAFSVNRLVKCDFYKKYVLKDFKSKGKCNHGHSPSSHSCNYFKIFKGNLKSSNYYLLVDDGEKYHLKYFVDTTGVSYGKPWKTATSNSIFINDEINFYDDSSAVVFVHFDKPNAKALLVSVPKDFDKNKLEYDYFRTNDCQFILKGWY